MLGLLIVIIVIVGISIYAFEEINRLYKSGKLSYISDSKLESSTKCTIEDYKYFELINR